MRGPGGLDRFAWRSLLARPLRSALTVAGIGFGVAVLFATLSTNAGIDAAIDRTVQDLIGRTDLRVTAFSQGGLSAATVQAIAGTPGVAVAAPEIERRTYPAADATRPLVLPDPVTVLGIDPGPDASLHDLALSAGSGLAGAGSPGALISDGLARAMGVTAGNLASPGGASPSGGASIVLQGADGPHPEPIVGILANAPPIDSAGRLVVVSLGEAQALFATDTVSRVDIGLAAATSADAVAAGLRTRLTAEPYILSGPADLAASLRSSTADFQSTTALIAALALFGGAFLIFNTLSMTVVERMREVGLFRAAGATRRQVSRIVLVQAGILGVAGSLAGIVLGFALAAAIAAYVRASAIAPIDGPAVPPATVVAALAVGILVTLAGAIEPAIRAGRISPLESLRPSLTGRGSAVARLRWLVLVFVAVGLAGLLLWPAASGRGGVVRWLAVYGVLLVATLLTPFVIEPLGWLAGFAFRPFAPVAARLTRGSLLRDRGRSTLTVGALTVGLAMIVALGGVAKDTRRAATAWIAGVVPGDVVATSIRPVGLDEGVAAQLAAVPGVARVSPIATFEAAFRGVRLDAAAVVGADLLADGRLDFVAGDRTAALNALDAGGSAIVPRSLAERLAVKVGDEMAFPVGAGRIVRLRVVGEVERTIPGRTGETVLVGWHDATDGFGVTGADAFAVRYAPGAAATAGPALDQVARGLALDPSPLDRIAGVVDDALGRVFGLFDALAIMAVIVAALGVVNTLSMNVYERVREIGILRATGMTRRQVWRMVVVEAGVLGIVGAILGCLTGLVIGQVMIGLGGGGSLQLPFDPDWPTIVLAAIFGVLVAMLAAVWPARLASRIGIVRAVQFE